MREIDSADAYCRILATRHYENFSVASRVIPAQLRVHLMRFYAFCRTTDDFGDESGSPQAALERLSVWREQTQAFFNGAPATHPVFIALRPTAREFALDREPFLDLIEANVQDQRVHSYAAWPELRAYCMLSAAPVGRVVLKIFGADGERARSLSDDVCIGLQLANHAQDVSRDRMIDRSYLLQTDLDMGGTPAAVRSLVERARDLLASGRELEGMVPKGLRVQLALYRLGGLAICDAIAALHYRTDVRRPSVSKAKKMHLVLQAIALAANG